VVLGCGPTRAFSPARAVACSTLTSQKVFVQSCCKSQFLHKSVNLSFATTIMKDTLMVLCGNSLLQSDFINTFREVNPRRGRPASLAATRSVTQGIYRGISLTRKRNP